ncbi:hypothetical protein [Candidatus Methylobacter oryzae]|uniref:Uncharacterized protein n=1 Tax=Candidatus Methylobacter oryzae TaxID=2497749 RepID=A0ABY3C8J4_9GAMM|nr:hypothetical protein [Candidatus Methylobacter oryzae]TRW90005.1 hypothetical protein EKO24_020510 [Candidatus Methylobacter oryzae]
MVEVKIREVVENISALGPVGMQLNQAYSYLQLYFSESGEVVSDNIYTLKQGEQEQMCNIIDGKAIGVEWVDRNQPMFLV